MKLFSTEFEDGGKIPVKYGYSRSNINPPLKFEDVPQSAMSLALIMDDPDAMEPAGKVWDHWVLWNIDPSVSEIGENSVPDGAVEGKTDYGENRYGGPNPPDKEHSYRFRLLAIDKKIDLPGSADKDQLLREVENHVIEEAKLFGRYAPQ